MPRMSKAMTTDFWSQMTAARDLQDPTALADWLLQNSDRLPQWARDAADREMYNIGVSVAANLGDEPDIPADVREVFSLVPFNEVDPRTGDVTTTYRTIKTVLEEGQGIEDVQAAIEATLEAWGEQYMPDATVGDVVTVWSVRSESAPELTFPLGPNV